MQAALAQLPAVSNAGLVLLLRSMSELSKHNKRVFMMNVRVVGEVSRGYDDLTLNASQPQTSQVCALYRHLMQVSFSLLIMHLPLSGPSR